MENKTAPENIPGGAEAPVVNEAEMSIKDKSKTKEAVANAISKVPNEMKIVILGGFLAFIGCFLPWWSMNSAGPYGSTYSINAFVDSTFFLGVLVFLMAIFSIVVAVFEFLDKRPAFFSKIPHSLIQLMIGAEMTLLMFIAISIFTSPRFSSAGTVSSKIEAGISFGSFVTVLGAVMIAVGGWLEWKGADILTSKLHSGADKDLKATEPKAEEVK